MAQIPMTDKELLDTLKDHITLYSLLFEDDPTHFIFLDINDYYEMAGIDDIVSELNSDDIVRLRKIQAELGIQILFKKLPNTQGKKCDGVSDWCKPNRFFCCTPHKDSLEIEGVEIQNDNPFLRKYIKPSKEFIL